MSSWKQFRSRKRSTSACRTTSTGSLWPSWRPTHPSWRSSRGRKAQPRLLPDSTNSPEMATAHTGQDQQVPCPLSLEHTARLGRIKTGPWRRGKKREALGWDPTAGVGPALSSGFPLLPSAEMWGQCFRLG
uniref:RAB11 family interacting protein 3 n=1 Tax=Rousettus aegyptiacus TaxID=9407 RepID=A0A7J8F324_ROUAE|nr:RAB11 family interacting protein 3 [Rousettus aegyptiacus]